MNMVETVSTTTHSVLDTPAKRIRAVLDAKKLDVSDAAKRSDVSRNSMSSWANGRTEPRPESLRGFAKIVECQLEWLVSGKGPAPDFIKDGNGGENIGAREMNTTIPEISGSMAAHASELDVRPISTWSIPTQVLVLGFNAEPPALVAQRVVNTDRMVERGDYLLIDGSRTKIDDSGCYMVTRDDGEPAFRIEIEWQDGELVLVNAEISDWRNLKILGRIMGFLRPA